MVFSKRYLFTIFDMMITLFIARLIIINDYDF
jgi:hypothetical protein